MIDFYYVYDIYHEMTRLSQRRHELGRKQAQMAKALKVSQSYLSNVEAGISTPDAILLVDFAREYGVHIQQMIDILEDTRNACPKKKRKPQQEKPDAAE